MWITMWAVRSAVEQVVLSAWGEVVQVSSLSQVFYAKPDNNDGNDDDDENDGNDDDDSKYVS